MESFAYTLREERIIAPAPGRSRAALVLAEARADGDLVTALGAAAAEHGGAGLGLHACKKSVLLHAAAAVGLKGAFRHGLKETPAQSRWCNSL